MCRSVQQHELTAAEAPPRPMQADAADDSMHRGKQRLANADPEASSDECSAVNLQQSTTKSGATLLQLSVKQTTAADSNAAALPHLRVKRKQPESPPQAQPDNQSISNPGAMQESSAQTPAPDGLAHNRRKRRRKPMKPPPPDASAQSVPLAGNRASCWQSAQQRSMCARAWNKHACISIHMSCKLFCTVSPIMNLPCTAPHRQSISILLLMSDASGSEPQHNITNDECTRDSQFEWLLRR